MVEDDRNLQLYLGGGSKKERKKERKKGRKEGSSTKE
jgi:hypothetical protein